MANRKSFEMTPYANTSPTRLIGDVQTGVADFTAILIYDVSRWGRFQDADESGYYEYICKRRAAESIIAPNNSRMTEAVRRHCEEHQARDGRRVQPGIVGQVLRRPGPDGPARLSLGGFSRLRNAAFAARPVARLQIRAGAGRAPGPEPKPTKAIADAAVGTQWRKPEEIISLFVDQNSLLNAWKFPV